MCKVCLECGAEIQSQRATFCSVACRKEFNNRRAQRGAELYDLWMANNYERGLRSEGLLSVMSNLARAYRASDQKRRAGRRSWNAKETLDRLPLSFGEDGDRR